MTIQDELNEAHELIRKVDDVLARIKTMHALDAVDAATERIIKEAVDE